MMYRLLLIALLPAFALLAGCSSQEADPAAAISQNNKAFVEQFLAGDEKALAALYTEDAKVIAPGVKVAKGRSEIAAFWRGVMDSGVKDLTLRTLEVESSGDMAYEVGAVSILGQDGSPSGARYVVVWKRMDGKWYLHRDIWNAGQQLQ